jgi:hypothetical protein
MAPYVHHKTQDSQRSHPEWRHVRHALVFYLKTTAATLKKVFRLFQWL